MRHRSEESPIWIGYADFLTTLAIFFFVISVTFAGKLNRSRSGFLIGIVRASAGGQGLRDCLIKMGRGRQMRTNERGGFEFRLDSLREPANVGVIADCVGYSQYSEIVTISPGDTAYRDITLEASKNVHVDTLPGDALFGSSESTLQPAAVDTLVQLGLRLKAELEAGKIIAVQGHTDDLPFQPGAVKDNWVLSGERAAAAARVLTDPKYGVAISPCQVVIMGFGPSRPAERIMPQDSRATRTEKRRKNRRIEFRMLSGSNMVGGNCDG